MDGLAPRLPGDEITTLKLPPITTTLSETRTEDGEETVRDKNRATIYTCLWIGGKRAGFCRWFHCGHVVHEVPFEKGLRSGMETIKNLYGVTLYTAYWKNNKLTGYATLYDSSGKSKLWSCMFMNGDKAGVNSYGEGNKYKKTVEEFGFNMESPHNHDMVRKLIVSIVYDTNQFALPNSPSVSPRPTRRAGGSVLPTRPGSANGGSNIQAGWARGTVRGNGSPVPPGSSGTNTPAGISPSASSASLARDRSDSSSTISAFWKNYKKDSSTPTNTPPQSSSSYDPIAVSLARPPVSSSPRARHGSSSLATPPTGDEHSENFTYYDSDDSHDLATNTQVLSDVASMLSSQMSGNGSDDDDVPDVFAFGDGVDDLVIVDEYGQVIQDDSGFGMEENQAALIAACRDIRKDYTKTSAKLKRAIGRKKEKTTGSHIDGSAAAAEAAASMPSSRPGSMIGGYNGTSAPNSTDVSRNSSPVQRLRSRSGSILSTSRLRSRDKQEKKSKKK